MELFNVNWVEDCKSTPVQSIHINNNGSRTLLRPHPDEELFLACASKRICELARFNPDCDFTISYKSGTPQNYFWISRKIESRYSPIIKIDSSNRLIPIKVRDREEHTLDEVSKMICQMARSYPDEIFEILKESPLAANYLPY